ncbi:MAG: VWA domain-containing protein [Acidobacteriota bacterium]
MLALCAWPALAFQPDLGHSPTQSIPRWTPTTAERLELATDIRVDTSLVLVPVQVTTREGSPITDLRPNAFRIYEEGVEQNVSYFARDDAPVSIGFIFDSSASMGKKKQKAVEAAAAFFRTANSEDEFFLIEFDENARLTVPFTNGTAELYQEIRHTRPYGRTSLYDAIYLGLATMKHASHERKALVIVSDGADNRSRHNFVSIKNALAESDVQLYSMAVVTGAVVTGGIFTGAEESEAEGVSDSRGTELLAQLAEITGGQNFSVDLDNFVRVSERIGMLLRNRYLVGYIPSNVARDGKYRRVAVNLTSLTANATRLQFRRGYYAPAH